MTHIIKITEAHRALLAKATATFCAMKARELEAKGPTAQDQDHQDMLELNFMLAMLKANADEVPGTFGRIADFTAE